MTARAVPEPMPEQVQTDAEPFATVIRFDYTSPPLTANQRMHWRKKAEITKTVRAVTALKAARIPALGKCRVTLTWVVTTKRRRDADNIVPTLKAMCDGLVDAGIVADDTPDLMEKVMPVIVYEKGGTARMELRVEMIGGAW